MQHGKPFAADGTNVQPDTREGQAGRHRVAESVRRSEEGEIGVALISVLKVPVSNSENYRVT